MSGEFCPDSFTDPRRQVPRSRPPRAAAGVARLSRVAPRGLASEWWPPPMVALAAAGGGGPAAARAGTGKTWLARLCRPDGEAAAACGEGGALPGRCGHWSMPRPVGVPARAGARASGRPGRLPSQLAETCWPGGFSGGQHSPDHPESVTLKVHCKPLIAEAEARRPVTSIWLLLFILAWNSC